MPTRRRAIAAVSPPTPAPTMMIFPSATSGSGNRRHAVHLPISREGSRNSFVVDAAHGRSQTKRSQEIVHFGVAEQELGGHDPGNGNRRDSPAGLRPVSGEVEPLDGRD